jgi:hypothetical protein
MHNFTHVITILSTVYDTTVRIKRIVLKKKHANLILQIQFSDILVFTECVNPRVPGLEFLDIL